MHKKNRRPGKLRRELLKVQAGEVPSEWLIKKCWKDEEHGTLALRRKVFPNLCAEPTVVYTFTCTWAWNMQVSCPHSNVRIPGLEVPKGY